tara:strand:- start:836 stop:2044 length:1209 start_codon:yes stop_codon:yes gene_type:complete
MKSIWYISKYVKTSHVGNSGSRGFFLLDELSNKGFRCTIFSSYPFKYTKKFEKLITKIRKNFSYIYLDSYKFKKSNSIQRIISWVDFERKLFFLKKKNIYKPDVIIVSSLSLLTIINGLILKKKYSCKLFFEIRDIWPLTLTEEGGFSDRNLLIIFLKFLEFIGYKYSDHIIGTMPNLKEHVENVIGYSKKVSCIPIGFNNEEIKKGRDIKKNIKILIPQNKFIVGYFGGIGISNALNSFFHTINKLEKNIEIHFIIAGEGDLKNNYIAQYKNLNNITFLPLIEKKYIHSLISFCDLLYFSTCNSKVWRYGQSLNKLIDYMLSGIPIIGSYDGYKTMINESGCGEFIRPNDSNEIMRVIFKYKQMSKLEREYIGKKGKDWLLKNRSYKNISDSLSKIILENT